MLDKEENEELERFLANKEEITPEMINNFFFKKLSPKTLDKIVLSAFDFINDLVVSIKKISINGIPNSQIDGFYNLFQKDYESILWPIDSNFISKSISLKISNLEKEKSQVISNTVKSQLEYDPDYITYLKKVKSHVDYYYKKNELEKLCASKLLEIINAFKNPSKYERFTNNRKTALTKKFKELVDLKFQINLNALKFIFQSNEFENNHDKIHVLNLLLEELNSGKNEYKTPDANEINAKIIDPLIVTKVESLWQNTRLWITNQINDLKENEIQIQRKEFEEKILESFNKEISELKNEISKLSEQKTVIGNKWPKGENPTFDSNDENFNSKNQNKKLSNNNLTNKIKTFEDLFHDSKSITNYIDVLRNVDPPLIDPNDNFIGRSKGAICVWIDELERQGIIKAEKDRKVLARIVKEKIKRFSIDESMFGKKQKKAEDNYRSDIKTLISQIKLSQDSQKGKLGK